MKWPGPAGRLSRVLVGCHPRRWRERYGGEMLDVLDQHQASARTVLNLTASVLSAHADPAYRAERPARIRLSDGEKPVIAVAAAVLAIVTVIFIGAWNDRWHLSGAGGVGGAAFAPGQHLLVSAVGGASQDSMDTMWDITDPARPRQLSAFQGGEPTALSPDGRIVATLSYDGQPVLWDVGNPGRPARIATMPTGGTAPLWGEAFSPDGRTLTVVVARQEGNVTASAFSIATRDTVFTWNVTSSGAVSGLTIAFRDVDDSQPTLAPDGRTVADGSPTSNAVYLWTPP